MLGDHSPPREVKTGTEAETMEESYLLACPSWFTQREIKTGVQWHSDSHSTPALSTVGEFQASRGYTARPWLKRENKGQGHNKEQHARHAQSAGSCTKLGQSLKMRMKRVARSLAGLLGPKEERQMIPWRNRLETEF